MTIQQPKHHYACRPPSLAFNVINFFVSNQDEALEATDIVAKWGAERKNIGVMLTKARECGALKLLGGIWMLGDMAAAKRCIDPDAAPDRHAPQSPAPAPAPRSIDDATGAEWNAASAAIRAQLKNTAAAPAPSVKIPGLGEVAITYEPLASKTTAYKHKWDPVLNLLASAPQCDEPHVRATIRLPREMSGAVKSGIESWHKRHKDLPFPCRFRASVSGDQVLVQCVALIERAA